MIKDVAFWTLLSLQIFGVMQSAQGQKPDTFPISQALTISTDAVEPNHFVAAHGRKSIIMGYPQEGLEIWGYPFQILSHYQVAFKAAGTTTATDGRLLMRRVDYRPDSITRVYIGPDYLVREKLFVPLDQAAAVISYEVEGMRHVDIEVSFHPVLDLMWPASLGGQYTRWMAGNEPSTEIPAFIISEPGRGYSAAVGSREAITHSDTVNSTIVMQSSLTQSGLSLCLRPSHSAQGAPSKAILYVALNPAGTKNASESLHFLSAQLSQLETEAETHYRALQRTAVRIRTPDNDVNRSLAFSLVALDQAWVCNPQLGCGLVAGYGPSRDARRPQYDWFFGGDGLVAANALVSAGEYSRAREELTFIQKYQDHSSGASAGMIWHELSQSAGFIDWSKYPYMFVHVDISFDYLATLARYVAVSGDIDFAKERWPSLLAAYRYCKSQIQDSDHLPHIPPDKEAGDEQHRPADDLGLAASWIAAASGFAELARLTGHREQAQGALDQVQLTHHSIPTHYWNAAKNFWFDGHTQSGEPIFRHAAGPTHLLLEHVFSPQQNEAVLNQLTSADFQADWGTREVAASSSDYNPYSYGAGSISALGTSAIATTFWRVHRPESAWALWNGIAQWRRLDSPGHIHEVLAGNFFHEETESVPEQTWSSAGFLDACVRGLLGLEIDGVQNRLHFAPHLPAEWNQLSVENIHLPHSTLDITIRQSMRSLDLDISNQGIATSVVFEPQIPLGAHLIKTESNGQTVESATETYSGDEHAKVTLAISPGATHYRLYFEGGLTILQAHPALHVGDSSSQLKLVKLDFRPHLLTIDADIRTDVDNRLTIRTPWKITPQKGAVVHSSSPNEYEVNFTPDSKAGSSPVAAGAYTRTRASISLEY